MICSAQTRGSTGEEIGCFLLLLLGFCHVFLWLISSPLLVAAVLRGAGLKTLTGYLEEKREQPLVKNLDLTSFSASLLILRLLLTPRPLTAASPPRGLSGDVLGSCSATTKEGEKGQNPEELFFISEVLE